MADIKALTAFRPPWGRTSGIGCERRRGPRDAELVAVGLPVGVTFHTPAANVPGAAKGFISVTRPCRDRCHCRTLVETRVQADRQGFGRRTCRRTR